MTIEIRSSSSRRRCQLHATLWQLSFWGKNVENSLVAHAMTFDPPTQHPLLNSQLYHPKKVALEPESDLAIRDVRTSVATEGIKAGVMVNSREVLARLAGDWSVALAPTSNRWERGDDATGTKPSQREDAVD
ncbi:hypothetical protein DPEC_G00344190 [Dallia pectoralis]|uniref:Uncharacterized protein n=1 Tax=Dallia pectoralis TaxID=75939 RepID=A0ACC2F360_DALPE|nr:hypothetical protein DPEC_G00344190 [Dallia pectoralis]